MYEKHEGFLVHMDLRRKVQKLGSEVHDNPNQRYDHCSRPDLTHDTQLKTGFPEDLIIAISIIKIEIGSISPKDLD